MEDGPGVRALGQARRPADRGRQAGRGRLHRRQDRDLDAASRPSTRRAWSAPTRWRHLRRRLRLRRAAAGRRPRHRRRRHRLRPHRARPRRRRLSGLAGATAIARSPTPSIPTAPTTRTCPCSAAEGAGDRGQEGRQVRPGQRRGDGQADRGRQPAGARPAGALLSALLALQGAGDLPQHARSGSSAWTSR